MLDYNNLKLTIDLVPATVWFSSVYQIYKKSGKTDEWYRIKNELYRKEGRKCWICGATGRLEAHEFWQYDDKNHIQKLVAIHHICGLCHKVKHIGFWCYTDEGKEQLRQAGLTRDDLIKHFCEVNNCSVKDFLEYEEDMFYVWEERSKYNWKQDFGIYNPYG